MKKIFLFSITLLILILNSCNKNDDNPTQQIPTSDKGLIAYYPFNGNAEDESGNHFNGTVVGASLTSDRFGNYNKAYYFNGINNWIQANNYPQLNSNFSCCVWIKIDKTNITDRGYNFGCYGKEGSGVATWDFGYNPVKQWFAVFNRPANAWAPGSSVNDDWHFVTIIFSSTKKSLYLDGKFVNSKDISTPINIMSNNDFRIGAHINDGSQQFRGSIDDVRIFSRVLTETEIQQFFHEGGW